MSPPLTHRRPGPHEVLLQVALSLRELGRPVTCHLGVDSELTAAIAAMGGAEARTSIYARDGEEPHAIDRASVRIGHVTLKCQARDRKVTATELEKADDWHEHADRYMCGRLR